VYFSRLFKNAKIACVEPMPGNIAILKENLRLNKVNSLVFEAAAAIENEKITMDTGDKDYGGKVHSIPFGKAMDNDTLVVEGLTINSMIEKLNWTNIDLLKIDIEGYEGVLLNKNNNWLTKVDTIIMEIHEGVTIDFIKKITAPYDFNYVRLQKGNWILSKKEIF
jgi:FkbM family methyltransferase